MIKTTRLAISLLCLAIILSMAITTGGHAEISPMANPVFAEASVYLSDQMVAEFTASTMSTCSSISVTSCVLQKKSGVNWVYASDLDVPSYVAQNDSVYMDVKNYANVIPSGGTYRLKVIFSGGGETVTRYSNSRAK